jgi:probable HAF family extracellular repeat protein
MSNRITVHLVRSLLVIALVGLVEVRAVADPVYSETNLGNGGWSLLNNNGQVAGGGYTTSHSPWSYTQVYNGNAGGQVTVIGVTPPSSSSPGSYDFPSTPLAMNDSGQLVIQGSLNTTSYDLYDHGTITPLPYGTVAINNAGQLTGTDAYNLPGLGAYQAYVQSGGVTTQLGVLPGAEISLPTAINNSGEVAGNSFHEFVANPNGPGVINAPSNQAWTHAFLYNGSTMVDLGTLGSKESYAAAMNNHGDVVGMSGIVASLDAGDPNQVFHAFYVPLGGKMVDLGTLPGTNASGATGINDKGQIVGWSGLSSTITAEQGTALTSHAFLYQNGLMTDLNMLVPQNGVVLTKALAINNQGQILVDGIDSKGNDEQLLLTPVGQPVPGSPMYGEAPVPEPSTLLVLVFGAIAFAAKWARKAV